MLICSRLLISIFDQMSNSSGSDFEALLKLEPKFEKFGFKSNPFSIKPLFSNLQDKASCERDKKLFVLTLGSEEAMKAFGVGRRIMIYGEVGSGKSSILYLLLYRAREERKYLPVRVLISEDNVKRAVQDILYTLCMEIIQETRRKNLSHPVNALRKWLLDKSRSDDFYQYMARLAGAFEEETTVSKTTKGSVQGKIGTGAIPGFSIGGNIESDQTVETKFKSKVDSLPEKVVENYFQDMIEAVEKIGHNGIAFGIDEIDHIASTDSVAAMLTVSRGIFFASDKPIFLVAASLDLAKRTELVRGVFDSMILVNEVSLEAMKKMLENRIKVENSKLSLNSTFEEKAVNAIYNYSDGLLKDGLRLAANSLAEAVIQNEIPVKQAQVKKAQSRSITHLSETLEPSEHRVFDALEQAGDSSPSSEELQKMTDLSRSQLDRILRNLSQRHIIRRRKEGKTFVYYI
jgi:hypothetical protein